jgi:hypothetical protein
VSPLAPNGAPNGAPTDASSGASVKSSKTSSLVAGRVPDCADLRSANVAAMNHAANPSGSLSFYRNPAEKNAAATGIAQGKIIDIEG